MIAALAGATIAASVAAATRAPMTRFELDEPHMGTTFRIVLYASDAVAAERAGREAFARITDLDRRLTDYKEDSELMRACRAAVTGPVTVSADVFRVLGTAQRLAERTGGAFDVTAGALTRLWRHARRQGTLPEDAEVAAARAVSGYRFMHLGGADHSVRFDRAGLRIDVGGIAKGYAADRALDVLRAHGLTRAMVVAGGEMALGDPPPDRCGWRVAVAPLSGGARAEADLELANVGVSTSGDAEQWMEVGGVRYSHILDPRTGQPLTRRVAVTVVAPDATTSDMLATTVAVLGAPDGLALADEYGAAVLFATRGGDGLDQRARSPRWTAAGPDVGGSPCRGVSSRTRGVEAPRPDRRARVAPVRQLSAPE